MTLYPIGPLRRLGAIIMLWLAGACGAGADEPADPGTILNRAWKTYDQLQYYAAEGTVEEVNVRDGAPHRRMISFSIKLAKPNRYLVTWSDGDGSATGAMWNGEGGPRLYVDSGGGKRVYNKMFNFDLGLASTVGISKVPVLFFAGVFAGQDTVSDEWPKMLKTLTAIRYEGLEAVDGEMCHVISGTIPSSTPEARSATIWVSTSRLLPLRLSDSYERVARAGAPTPAPTREEIEQAYRSSIKTLELLKQLQTKGPSATDMKALVKNMEAGIAFQVAMEKSLPPEQSVSVETQRRVAVDALTADAFRYAVPDGVPLESE